MSDPKFTKAPWRLGTKGPNGLLPIGHGQGEMICALICDLDNRANQEADAHLIAAAPDLYAALEEALRIAAEPDGVDLRIRESTIIAWKQNAIAALKKARGE